MDGVCLEAEKKALAQVQADKELDKMTLKETDETKSKEQLSKDLDERGKVPKMENSDVL